MATSTQYDSSPSADKNDSILPHAASFNLFEPATEAEITTLIHASQNKQCDLDPIPTSLLKECADLLVPTITNIINLSLSTGTFPMQFKDLVVKALLKKPSLDKELLSNNSSNLESIFLIQTVGTSRPFPSQRLSHLKQSPKPKSIRLHKTSLYRNTTHLAIQQTCHGNR